MILSLFREAAIRDSADPEILSVAEELDGRQRYSPHNRTKCIPFKRAFFLGPVPKGHIEGIYDIKVGFGVQSFSPTLALTIRTLEAFIYPFQHVQ